MLASFTLLWKCPHLLCNIIKHYHWGALMPGLFHPGACKLEWRRQSDSHIFKPLTCGVLLYMSSVQIIKKASSHIISCLSPTHGFSVTVESLRFNCWHALPPPTPTPRVMECIWIQATCSKSVHIWHNHSPGAVQLITLSNLVRMCRCSSDMI